MIFLLSAVAEAQLSAPGYSAIRYTSYTSAPAVKDPIFIYCKASGSQKGALSASSPAGTGPFNFAWYQWSDATKSFSTSVKTESGVLISSMSDLDQGGYKVVISGGFDTTFVGWIFTDNPYSSAALQNQTCDYVALKGQAAVDTFYYNNPSNGLPIKLPNGVSFLWTSNPTSDIPSPDFYLNPQTFDPPLVDVTYNLQVSDSFGCVSESSIFYPSIHAKADFSVDPEAGQAPLITAFTDKSIRASEYRWEFGDGKDSISTVSNPQPHTYYIPGEYSVKLTIKSLLGCIDSMRLEKNIIVDPSELKIPNVFTPDGDGLNDYFIVESKSLRSLSMEVFSRSGLKVYSFYGIGNLLKEWKGWDGNVNSTSVKASPGVYFYVIRASGWDNVVYNGKEYRGFVYLYR
jgi:gliding motility-associated-like protein